MNRSGAHAIETRLWHDEVAFLRNPAKVYREKRIRYTRFATKESYLVVVRRWSVSRDQGPE